MCSFEVWACCQTLSVWKGVQVFIDFANKGVSLDAAKEHRVKEARTGPAKRARTLQ